MFKIGDKVIVNPVHDARGRFAGVVFEVERFKQVNALLKPVSGPSDGRKLNCRPEYLLPAGEQPSRDVSSVGQPYLPALWAGQVVTVKSAHAKWHYAADARFVILAQTTPDRVKIALLGGEEGRTWTVPRSSVTVTA
jgi:hypothetical protein